MDQDQNLPQNEASEIKLTAIALGELSEAEGAELLAASLDPGAVRQAMAEATWLGDYIRQTQRDEPLPARSDSLRQLLEAKLAEPVCPAVQTARIAAWSRRRQWLPLSLAASLLVVISVVAALRSVRHDEPPNAVAMHDNRDRGELVVSRDVETHVSVLEAASEDMPLTVTSPASGAAGGDVPLAKQRSVELEVWHAGGDSPAADFSIMGTSGKPNSQSGPAAAGAVMDLPVTDQTRSGGGFGQPYYSPIRPTDLPARAGGSLGASQTPTGPRFITKGAAPWGRPDTADSYGATEGQMPATNPRFARANAEMPAASGMMAGGMGGLARTPEIKLYEGESRFGAVAGPSTESYAAIVENPFVRVRESPLSTFSIDVDTASYANVRRFLKSSSLPPPGAVRIEELVNYFSYDYPQPEGEAPFSVTTEVAGCPWNAEHRLLRVGLKGREIKAEQRPASNLAFLIDVSGSMNEPNKLPLVKEALLLLTEQLDEKDQVAIVTYAGNSGLVLPPTSGSDKRTIEQAISNLAAGGSTNGGEGIQTAYAVAQANFIKAGTNRVILATDGDFNVGVTDQNELVKLIEEQARGGVFFTALGFGAGNLKDDTLEKLADKGNGNYAYIDTLSEARKALVEQLSGTLVTIAKDVKLQLEFNPAQVDAYRLIGYENRVLAHADFNDDRKDAGEVGAGHTVTALYELLPAGKTAVAGVDELKYQRPLPALRPAAESNELMTLKLRYKQPQGEQSRLLEYVVTDQGKKYGQAGSDFKFAAAVAGFGMLLRGSQHAGDANYDAVLELAGEGLGSDLQGYRNEFVELVRKAKGLAAGK